MAKTAARRSGITLFAALAVLAACERPKPEPAQQAPSEPVAAPPPAPVLSTPAALSRADLLVALSRAASDYAAGAEADTNLAGRTFVIRLPFGCFGPGPNSPPPKADGLARWTWSKDGSSIRLAATPADWTRSPLVLAPGAEPPWDGVEGFWIERPWLLSDKCPEPAAPARTTPPESSVPDVVAPAPMTAGLAAIQSAEGSRLGRREGKDYSFAIRGSGNAPPPLPLQGYRLVLEGRIGAFPDGAAVRCTSAGPDHHPICLAAVQLDVVAFEDAAGVRLSEWRPG